MPLLTQRGHRRLGELGRVGQGDERAAAHLEQGVDGRHAVAHELLAGGPALAQSVRFSMTTRTLTIEKGLSSCSALTRATP